MEAVWFEPKPLNSSVINTMMTDIAVAAKLSRAYDNADIRATSWDNLQEAIEEFSENIRMGYRKNLAPQMQKASAATTAVATGSATGRHDGLPAVVAQINKSSGQQSSVSILQG